MAEPVFSAPTVESNNHIDKIFAAQTSAMSATVMRKNDLKKAMALAAAGEIIRDHSTRNDSERIQFTDGKIDINDPSSDVGKAARAALHNLPSYLSEKDQGNVRLMSATLAVDVQFQAQVQGMARVFDDPEYRKCLVKEYQDTEIHKYPENAAKITDNHHLAFGFEAVKDPTLKSVIQDPEMRAGLLESMHLNGADRLNESTMEAVVQGTRAMARGEYHKIPPKEQEEMKDLIVSRGMAQARGFDGISPALERIAENRGSAMMSAAPRDYARAAAENRLGEDGKIAAKVPTYEELKERARVTEIATRAREYGSRER